MVKEVNKKKRNQIDEKIDQFFRLIKRVNKLIKKEELRKYIITELYNIATDGKFMIAENMFSGHYKYKDSEIAFSIEFIFNSLSLTVKKDDIVLKTINYYETNKGYEIEHAFPISKEVEVNDNLFYTEEVEKLIQKYDNDNNLFFEHIYNESGNFYIETLNEMDEEFQKVKSIG